MKTKEDIHGPHDAPQWFDALNCSLVQTTAKVAGRPEAVGSAFQALEVLLSNARKEGACVWWVGNGGSSSICSHLSQDILNKLKIRSQVLSDASLMSCMANDFGYEQVYSRPLAQLARPGDVLIAISSSGQSKNILNCIEVAREKKMKTVGLSAFSTENLLWNSETDLSFYLPSHFYGVVEIGHSALLHAVIECMYLNEMGPR